MVAVKKGKKTVGYGFVGEWREPEELGWNIPNHIAASWGRKYPSHPPLTDWNAGAKNYLCKITIEEVLDSRGRRIVRKQKA